MNNKLNIDELILIDDTGMPIAPSIRQLLDPDVRKLYIRDTTKDKDNYIKECGVIYYLGDPKSPANQQGLSYTESLNMAIEVFDLPKDYQPDNLTTRLIFRYNEQCVGEAGKAVKVLLQAIHNVTLAGIKINEILNQKLSAAITDEDITTVVSLMDTINKKVADIPVFTKRLNEAYENLANAQETQMGRGGQQVLSSMNAEDY